MAYRSNSGTDVSEEAVIMDHPMKCIRVLENFWKFSIVSPSWVDHRWANTTLQQEGWASLQVRRSSNKG